MKLLDKINESLLESSWDSLGNRYRYYPEGTVFYYDAFKNSGLASVVGPDVLFNYQAQLYDGDTLLPINQPLITDSGLASGGGYTNEFAGEPTAPEIVTLTAQDYVLQCFDGGSISCSYGTATPDNPLSFTATAGNVTFTPTSVGGWMLTAGSYIHDYIPQGTTQPSMIGSTDNGMRVPIEEYVDEPDYVQLAGGDLMTTYYMRADGSASTIAEATSSDSPATSMDVTLFNATTFVDGDVIYMSDKGGDYTSTYLVPKGVGTTNKISLLAPIGETPVINGLDALSYGIFNIRANWVFDGITIKNTTIQAIRLGGTVDGSEFNNLILRDGGSGIYAVSSTIGDIEVNNIGVSGLSGAAIKTDGGSLAITADEFTITDCLVAMDLATDATVTNGLINFCNVGIQQNDTGTLTIDSVEVHDITGTAAGAALNGDGGSVTVVASNCHFYNIIGDAVTSNNGANVTIQDSIIHDVGADDSQPSGDGTTAHDASTLNVYGCTIYNCKKSGVAVTEGATGRIINNTIYNCFDENQTIAWTASNGVGIAINATGDWEIKNNICQNNGQEMVITSIATGTIDSDYNCLYPSRTPTAGTKPYHYQGAEYDTLAEYQATSGLDTNSIDSDPLLADPENGDFTISFDSPTISAGIAEIITVPVLKPKQQALRNLFTGGAMTLCTTVKMGVGSDDILTSSTINNICNVTTNIVASIAYYRGASTLINRGTDGVSSPFISSTWNKDDVISRFTQVSADGTQFRVGYLNHTEGDTSFTVSSWVAYDGSFDPEELMIMFFGNKHPNYLQQTYAIEGQYDLDKLAKEVLKNARV